MYKFDVWAQHTAHSCMCAVKTGRFGIVSDPRNILFVFVQLESSFHKDVHYRFRQVSVSTVVEHSCHYCISVPCARRLVMLERGRVVNSWHACICNFRSLVTTGVVLNLTTYTCLGLCKSFHERMRTCNILFCQ